jgi:formate dehydrogenase subunit gamma
MALFFLALFFRFKHLNQMTPADREWLGGSGDGGR